MKITKEQKQKRYDLFERSLLVWLDKKIEDAKYNDSTTSTASVLEGVMDWLDDYAPRDIYLLVDKILDENYGDFMSIGHVSIPSYRKEYKDFEEKIGG